MDRIAALAFALLCSLAPLSAAADPNFLPLGDGKYTLSGPRKGYVFVCRVMTGGRGASGDVSWIHGTTWDPSAKPVVPGNVKWPNAYVRVTVNGDERTIEGNGLPSAYGTGEFPVDPNSSLARIDRNPSSIAPHPYSIVLPAYPSPAAAPGCISGVVGVMNDGVWLFDAFDALYRDAPAHELMDACQGHPNPMGYHHHSLSSCYPKATLETVLGWALDGFPMTGAAYSDGDFVTTASLDECHGMTGDVLIDGKLTRTYHYVLTEDFPYSVGCFKGQTKAARQPAARRSALQRIPRFR